MSGASRRAAQQMDRDGIKRISAWTKPRHIGCANYQFPVARPGCEHHGCAKKAGYSMPAGKFCAEHTFQRSSAYIGGPA